MNTEKISDGRRSYEVREKIEDRESELGAVFVEADAELVTDEEWREPTAKNVSSLCSRAESPT